MTALPADARSHARPAADVAAAEEPAGAVELSRPGPGEESARCQDTAAWSERAASGAGRPTPRGTTWEYPLGTGGVGCAELGEQGAEALLASARVVAALDALESVLAGGTGGAAQLAEESGWWAPEARLVSLDPKRVLGLLSSCEALARQRQSLERREAQLRGFFERFHGIAMELDAETGDCTLCVGQVEAITGYTAAEIRSGRPRWGDLVHPEDRAGFALSRGGGVRTYRILGRTRGVVRVEEHRQERVSTLDGRLVDRLTLYDVTGRYEAEVARARFEIQRDEFVACMIRAQEEERTRVGRELHSGVAQVASSLALRLGLLASEHEHPDVHACGEMAHRLVREVRDLASILHPLPLAELGLEAALDELVRRLGERHPGVELEVLFAPAAHGVALPDFLATSLYRILQELLQHAIQVLRARRVSVVASPWLGGLRCVVELDGVASPGLASMELHSARERCALVGATLQQQRLEDGLTWVLEVPLPSGPEEPPPVVSPSLRGEP
jgi:signal transduction histidine kinase